MPDVFSPSSTSAPSSCITEEISPAKERKAEAVPALAATVTATVLSPDQHVREARQRAGRKQPQSLSKICAILRSKRIQDSQQQGQQIRPLRARETCHIHLIFMQDSFIAEGFLCLNITDGDELHSFWNDACKH